MADPFARIRVLGQDVVCYLRPGAQCDLAALERDVNEACAECGSVEDLQIRMKAVADRHGLDVDYEPTTPVPADPTQRLVSFGFLPRHY